MKKNYIKSLKLHKAGEDEWNDAINARGKLEEIEQDSPTQCQAVPMSNPSWSADEEISTIGIEIILLLV